MSTVVVLLKGKDKDPPRGKPTAFITVGAQAPDEHGKGGIKGKVIPVWGMTPSKGKPGKLAATTSDGKVLHVDAKKHEEVKAKVAKKVGGTASDDAKPSQPADTSEAKPASRLDRLNSSLERKKAKADAAFDAHFSDVASANGQPLNDKRDGRATLDRWERQSNAIRAAQDGVKKTERAIEREQIKAAGVEHANSKLPQYVTSMVESGDLAQWRKHPNTFFVPGVDKGRIVVDLETGAIGARYIQDIPKEQYPKFRDTVNALLAKHREAKAESQRPAAARSPTLQPAPRKSGAGGLRLAKVTEAQLGVLEDLQMHMEASEGVGDDGLDWVKAGKAIEALRTGDTVKPEHLHDLGIALGRSIEGLEEERKRAPDIAGTLNGLLRSARALQGRVFRARTGAGVVKKSDDSTESLQAEYDSLIARFRARDPSLGEAAKARVQDLHKELYRRKNEGEMSKGRSPVIILLKGAAPKPQTGPNGETGGRWVTMRGRHVYIGSDGRPVNPPGGMGGRSEAPKKPKASPKPSDPAAQPHQSLDAIYKAAAEAKPHFDQAIHQIGKALGAEVMTAPLKGIARATEKMHAKFGGDASKITDVCRASLVFEDEVTLRKALGQVPKIGQVVRNKDRFANPTDDGYRDVALLIRHVPPPSGHVVELQLHAKPIMKVKQGPGHALYERTRSIHAKAALENRPLTKGEVEQLEHYKAEATRLYGDAYAKFKSSRER